MKIYSKLPATMLVFLAMLSVQAGAGFAKQLFQIIAPEGVVFLRVLFAALVLLVLVRPSFRSLNWSQIRVVMVFGFVLAMMNYFYYLSLQRLSLGLAVTIEFLGPLSVALWKSHHKRDWIWVALAGFGVALLSPFSGAVDPFGVTLALLAGVCWAAYILIGQHMGAAIAGNDGLALAMLAGTVFLLPLGLAEALPALQQAHVLLIALGVAIMSSVIPYSLEIEALRRMPSRLFSIFMSAEPAIAAVLGFLILSERLDGWQISAILAVTVASFGAARFSAPANK